MRAEERATLTGTRPTRTYSLSAPVMTILNHIHVLMANLWGFQLDYFPFNALRAGLGLL